MQIGRVVELARYPVKSMRGEHLTSATLERRGVAGDRFWAAYTDDGGIGSGKTTRRFRRVDGLLEIPVRLDGGAPLLELDGVMYDAADPATAERLSALLGRPVTLQPETTTPHHDDSPVHVVTTAGIRELERLLGTPVARERFRANIVLDVQGTGFVEDAWEGRELALGDEVVLRVAGPMERCVMVGTAQGRLPHDARILKTLADAHDLGFGAQAVVVREGVVRVGDAAVLG